MALSRLAVAVPEDTGHHRRLRLAVLPQDDGGVDVVGAVLLAVLHALDEHQGVGGGARDQEAHRRAAVAPALQLLQVAVGVGHRARVAEGVEPGGQQGLQGAAAQQGPAGQVDLPHLVQLDGLHPVGVGPGIGAGGHGEHQLPPRLLLQQADGAPHPITPAASFRSSRSARVWATASTDMSAPKWLSLMVIWRVVPLFRLCSPASRAVSTRSSWWR